MPKSKQRRKTVEKRADLARADQERAEAKKLTPQQYARRRAFGWLLVALAVAIGVSHWVQHVGAIELLTPGLADLVIGYPTAAALAVAGAIVLSK
jgi:hypothetical protein